MTNRILFCRLNAMSKNKAIFLDRDGVINKLIMKEGVGRAPYSIDDFEMFEGVIEACQKLKDSQFLNIIVTNQPDVSRGWVSLESVKIINSKILELVAIDDIKICFHTNEDQCLCRKPAPGMLLEAAKEWEIDLSQSYMIGDRYGDLSAGISAGCKTILVGPGDSKVIKGEFPIPDFKANSLWEAVEWILMQV